MKTAPNRVHALAASLGARQAEVVGHDIGLMVAYAYAAQYPAEVEKLVVLDGFLPGADHWEAVYKGPEQLAFPVPRAYSEALLQGRERTFFEYFWDDLAADKTRSIPEADREAYTAACSRPGRKRAVVGVLRVL